MTEEEARAWLRMHFGVSRETAVDRFIALMVDENARQNLVSAGSLGELWRRHVVDSAQLLMLAPPGGGDRDWFDIGTGAGFPGLIVALLSDYSVTLIEPRRRRADFLAVAVERIGIGSHCRVACARAENVVGRASIISARAVAALPDLFKAGQGISTEKTLWLLPKGASAREEMAAARQTWQGSFHVKPSVTQPGSFIVVATGVKPR